jgi:hypothetical protein
MNSRRANIDSRAVSADRQNSGLTVRILIAATTVFPACTVGAPDYHVTVVLGC